eukprot:1146984-Pelagomonas_calceolata.AAC.1
MARNIKGTLTWKGLYNMEGCRRMASNQSRPRSVAGWHYRKLTYNVSKHISTQMLRQIIGCLEGALLDPRHTSEYP